MSNDKNEPVADATPAEEQIASLEQDEIDNVDLTLISGGLAKDHASTCPGGQSNPTY